MKPALVFTVLVSLNIVVHLTSADDAKVYCYECGRCETSLPNAPVPCLPHYNACAKLSFTEDGVEKVYRSCSMLMPPATSYEGCNLPISPKIPHKEGTTSCVSICSGNGCNDK